MKDEHRIIRDEGYKKHSKISTFQLQTFVCDNKTLSTMWDITGLYSSHSQSQAGLCNVTFTYVSGEEAGAGTSELEQRTKNLWAWVGIVL